MSRKTFISRPFYISFNFHRPHSAERLDQIFKLTRNFVASLDLGCPNVAHSPNVGLRSINGDGYLEVVSIHGMSERDRYLLWVKEWKQIYASLSTLIRNLKLDRKTSKNQRRLSDIQTTQIHALMKSFGTNEGIREYLTKLSANHLPDLQEAAQIMLNARYNAKLAAGMRRQIEIMQAEADLDALTASHSHSGENEIDFVCYPKSETSDA